MQLKLSVSMLLTQNTQLCVVLTKTVTFSSSTEKLVTLFTKLYQLLLRNTWAKSTKNWELTTIYSTTMVQKMQTA